MQYSFLVLLDVFFLGSLRGFVGLRRRGDRDIPSFILNIFFTLTYSIIELSFLSNSSKIDFSFLFLNE